MKDATYWEHRYNVGTDIWDLGQASPGLVAWLADHPEARGKALVVGCGPGHDAVALAKHGFDVTAIDFAPTARVETQENAAKAGVELRVLDADIFALPADLKGADYVFEHTCFCAIDPDRRPAYVNAMADVLAPGGQLVGIFFTFPPDGEPGPPHTSTPQQIRDAFAPRFDVVTLVPETHSVENRRDEEHLGVFKVRT